MQVTQGEAFPSTLRLFSKSPAGGLCTPSWNTLPGQRCLTYTPDGSLIWPLLGPAYLQVGPLPKENCLLAPSRELMPQRVTKDKVAVGVAGGI